MDKSGMIGKLKEITKEDGIENTAEKVGISTGHFHKLLNRPQQYPLTKKMRKRIEKSGLIDG